MKHGKHERPMPTVLEHLGLHTADYLDDPTQALGPMVLAAEWGIVSQYAVELANTSEITVDTTVSRTLDDSDTETELWCTTCMVELDEGEMEIDYV